MTTDNLNKKYRTLDNNLFVGACIQNGKYVLIIYRKYKKRNGYSRSVKEFDTPYQANGYFKAIKKTNPTLMAM